MFLSRTKFKNKINQLKQKGLKIAGYAASAKSTTALNFCRLNKDYQDYIADNTKEKIGKFTPGTHIPIVSINHLKNYPDVVVLNSWNHKRDTKQEKNLSKTEVSGFHMSKKYKMLWRNGRFGKN